MPYSRSHATAQRESRPPEYASARRVPFGGRLRKMRLMPPYTSERIANADARGHRHEELGIDRVASEHTAAIRAGRDDLTVVPPRLRANDRQHVNLDSGIDLEAAADRVADAQGRRDVEVRRARIDLRVDREHRRAVVTRDEVAAAAIANRADDGAQAETHFDRPRTGRAVVAVEAGDEALEQQPVLRGAVRDEGARGDRRHAVIDRARQQQIAGVQADADAVAQLVTATHRDLAADRQRRRAARAPGGELAAAGNPRRARAGQLDRHAAVLSER